MTLIRDSYKSRCSRERRVRYLRKTINNKKEYNKRRVAMPHPRRSLSPSSTSASSRQPPPPPFDFASSGCYKFTSAARRPFLQIFPPVFSDSTPIFLRPEKSRESIERKRRSAGGKICRNGTARSPVGRVNFSNLVGNRSLWRYIKNHHRRKFLGHSSANLNWIFSFLAYIDRD